MPPYARRGARTIRAQTALLGAPRNERRWTFDFTRSPTMKTNPTTSNQREAETCSSSLLFWIFSCSPPRVLILGLAATPRGRFGATAWPKLRGRAPPPPPRRREPQGGGGGGGGVREAGGRGTASTSRRPAGGRDGEGGERQRLSGAADCSWHSPSLHTGSPDAASSRPPSRQGHGSGNSKGKGPALRGDGGGGAGVNVGGGGGGTKAAGAATRGPSLRDRPARWAAKVRGPRPCSDDTAELILLHFVHSHVKRVCLSLLFFSFSGIGLVIRAPCPLQGCSPTCGMFSVRGF